MAEFPCVPNPELRSARAVRLRELFSAALDRPAADRTAWVAEQTLDDLALLSELQELLEAHERASQFFPSSPWTSRPFPVSVTGHQRTGTPVATADLVGRRLGHYRVDRWLGAGGMGEVYEAWDLALDRAAAIKIIRRDGLPDTASRLLREADACVRLQHPAIATFHEVGTDGDHVFLAMELVRGETLRERLRRGPLTPLDALALTTGLLEALAHAHAVGLLHRDIKPENVMLTSAGAPKLLDFGIARPWVMPAPHDAPTLNLSPAASEPVTLAVAGTPGYLSPEQLRGDVLTPASDVFQVGLLLYEMLTGTRAFGDGSAMARMAATLAGPPDLTSLSELPPAGLAGLLARALATDPADRIPSASAFLREVDGLLDVRLRRVLPDSLVIIPFTAMPAPSDDDAIGSPLWLGAALTETIAAGLGRRHDLRLIATPRPTRSQASVPLSPIAAALELGARWMVTGTFRLVDRHAEVNISLTDSSTGAEVLGFARNGTVEEVLSADAVVAPVVDALELDRAESGRRPAREQARVIELCQMARTLWQSGSRDSHPRVLALLNEALELAHDSVAALSLLAAARATAFIASRDPADLEQALHAADRAIALDPGRTDARSWRAYALLRLQRVDEALIAYEEAIRHGADANASYLYGSTLSSLGRFEEGLTHLQRAVTLEPQYGIAWLSLGWTLHSLLRPEAALYALRKARLLEGQPGPTFVAGVGGYIADCLRSIGELALARDEARHGLQSIEQSDHSYRDTIRAFCLCALGRVALAQADAGAARAAFSQAVTQMRGRTRTQAGGFVFVQALAGLARADGDSAVYDEAAALFTTRDGYSFSPFFGCGEDNTAFELALAASRFERRDDIDRWLRHARAAGNRQPFPENTPG